MNLAEQAEAAVQIAAAWRQQVNEIDTVEDHVGEVAFFWEAAAIGR